MVLPSGREVLRALSAYVAERWKLLLDERQRVLRQPHPEAIHDLRVASRRLRAVLDQLRLFQEAKVGGRVTRSIRRLTRRLGGIRDHDEALQYFSGLGFSGLEPLCNRLQRRREREVADLLHWLAKPSIDDAGRHVAVAIRGLANGSDTSAEQALALLAERSLQLYLPIAHLVPRVVQPEHEDDRHALRIALKKWRYFNELLGPVTGADTAVLLEQLRSYQAVLGRLNDLAVFEALCARAELAEELDDAVRQQIARQRQELDADFLRLLAQQPLHYTLLL